MPVAPKYPHVFSPVQIGPVIVRNRFYMAPNNSFLVATGPHGSWVPSTDYAYYLAERAAGGVGLVFMSTTILPRYHGPCPLYEESIPDFSAVAELVHRRDAKVMGQLHYGPRPSTLPWEPLGALMPALGPSDYQMFDAYNTAHELSIGEIQELVAIHGRCTRNLRDAGLDGVQLHVSRGTLLNKMLSPYFNRRRDDYGGDLDGRMRMLVETLREVHRNAGAEMAVGIRLNVDEMLPGGMTRGESRDVLRRLVDLELLHFADLDVAIEPEQVDLLAASMFVEPLHIAKVVADVGRAVKGRIVVMAAGGRVTTVRQAEKLLADGELDMVGAARQFIAEPELLKNSLAGREDLNRTCIAMNFCLRARFMGHAGTWGCVINPASARERRWGVRTLTPAAKRRKVVVVGAGPAGLEAARIAGTLGHEVVVFERADRVGGQLNMWASLPQREVLRTTIDWYQRRLDELGLRILTGVEATSRLVLAEGPDAVLVATGSRYDPGGRSGFTDVRFAPIPGWNKDFVHTPEAILEDGARPTGRILLLDEDRMMHTGVGIAQLLAERGAEVEIVSRDLGLVGDGVSGAFDHKYLIPKLVNLGVKLTPATYIKEIGDRQVRTFHVLTGIEDLRDVDGVVLVTMRRSLRSLADELEGKVDQLYTIGDALAARSLFEATYEGQRFARLIGIDGAPRDISGAIFAPPPAEAFPQPARRLFDEEDLAGAARTRSA